MGISSSEGSTYSYSGFVSLLDQVSYTAPVGPYADSSNYSSFEWSKSRTRSGSESESIAGSTSGATFQYSSYSKNNTRDDDTEFEGYRYFDSTGPLGSGTSRQTLIYDETLAYDYTASTSNYTVSIDYTAPWTLSQSSSFLGTSSTSGTITKNEDDSGEDEKEVPAPVEVVGNFDGAKTPEYYGLGAPLAVAYDDKNNAQTQSVQEILKQSSQPKKPRIPVKPIEPVRPDNDMLGPKSPKMIEYYKKLKRYEADLADYKRELRTYDDRLLAYNIEVKLLDKAKQFQDGKYWEQKHLEEMEAFLQTVREGKRKTIDLFFKMGTEEALYAAGTWGLFKVVGFVGGKAWRWFRGPTVAAEAAAASKVAPKITGPTHNPVNGLGATGPGVAATPPGSGVIQPTVPPKLPVAPKSGAKLSGAAQRGLKPNIEHIATSANSMTARRKASVLAGLGEDSIPFVSELGPQKGWTVGRQSKDGLRGWRMDWDSIKGYHVNWWDRTGGPKRKDWINGAELIKDGTWLDYIQLLIHGFGN